MTIKRVWAYGKGNCRLKDSLKDLVKTIKATGKAKILLNANKHSKTAEARNVTIVIKHVDASPISLPSSFSH